MTDTLGTNLESDLKAQKKTTKPVGMPDTVRIILEENQDIPPTGLFLSHNGRAYMIVPGEPVDIPRHVLEILDNAVMSTPQTDPGTKQVIGYRERMRYPYRLVNA
jgi:hypothetical protein